ncbi:MAG: DUF427 domain-containing protein [Paracoccaceae bacterium]|nr:DUF427 domain-containing protein [Paracoccaceae bacterium]
MENKIRIRPVEGTWVVRAGGAVLGETSRARELDEPGRKPVVYFPREDIAMAFLERSDHHTTCPLKGQASYYSIQTKSTLIENAGWSYENPFDEVADIGGFLAFYEDKVTVEKV